MHKLYDKYRAIIIYVLFGVLTTVVNWMAYFPLYYAVELSATVSNAIAWCAAVVFAYFTNKIFVFKCKDWSVKHVITELLGFVAWRFVSGLLETAFLLVVVDIYSGNGVVWKLVAGCIVFVLNYLGSRFFVFKNNKNIPSE